MTILSFPTGIRNPTSVQFGLAANTQSGGKSPFDGTEQTLALPGDRWAAEIRWGRLNEAEWRILQAFVASLQGRAGRFTWGPGSFMPRKGDAVSDGSALGPRILGAGQTGKTINVTGFAGPGGYAFRKGDLVGWLNPAGRPQLHMATEDVPSADPTATNLLTNSNALGAATWAKSANVSVTENAVAGPTGAMDGDTLTCLSTSAGFVSRSVSITAGGQYGLSWWLAPGSLSWCYIQVSTAGQTNLFRSWFNLAGKAKGSQQATGAATLASAEVIEVAGDWVRVGITGICDAVSTSVTVTLNPCNGNVTAAQTAGGTIHAGGAQFEAQGITPYIPTTTAPATRTQSLAVPIVPAIRRSPSADTPLILTNPTAVWRLTDDKIPLEYGNGVFATLTLPIEEAIF